MEKPINEIEIKEIVEFDDKKENYQIRQSNHVIESAFKATLTEIRIVVMLLAMIKYDDEDFKQYKLNINTFAKVYGISGNSVYDLVKKSTDNLTTTKIHITDGDRFIQTTWLSSATYDKNSSDVVVRFDPSLKPYLIRVQERGNFTTTLLSKVIKFKSPYTVRFYLCFKQYQNLPKARFRKFKVQDLKKIFKCEKEYPHYGNFKSRVINPSILEINAVSDDLMINYPFEEIKIGKKVDSVIFEIKNKEKENEQEKSGSEDELKQDLEEKEVGIRPRPDKLNFNKAPTGFKKPTYQELFDYLLELDSGVNPQEILDHYDSVGWKVGKLPMKDWKAAVRKWVNREWTKHDFAGTKKSTKTTNIPASAQKTDSEIQNLLATIRTRLHLDFQDKDGAWRKFFSDKIPEKSGDGYVIYVTEPAALTYQECLKKVNVKIEVKA